MEEITSDTIAITRILFAINNGINSEAKNYDDTPFRIKKTQLEAIRINAKRILSKEHKKKVEIMFNISENPKDIENALPQHPNKIFQF